MIKRETRRCQYHGSCLDLAGRRIASSESRSAGKAEGVQTESYVTHKRYDLNRTRAIFSNAHCRSGLPPGVGGIEGSLSLSHASKKYQKLKMGPLLDSETISSLM